MRTSQRALTALALGVPLVLASMSPSLAAPKTRKSVDTTPPSVAVAAPTAGSTTSDAFTVSGGASDNNAVSAVYVELDTGAWSAAIGTTSWSLPFSGVSAGSHTVVAKAVDRAGNVSTATVAFSVASPTTSTTSSPTPAPAPTTSPSPSPSPTATVSPSPSSTTTSTSTTASTSSTAPDTQGSWVSPEGVHINVNTAGPFTIASVFQMLLDASAGPGDFSRLAPMLTVNVQDTYASGTSVSAAGFPGSYGSYSATIWLKGVNSVFASYPDMQLTHEYGHAWTLMHFYLDHGGDWSPYLGTRWSSSDGSLLLGQDSRLGSSYNWSTDEIVADDYRLLFGAPAALVTGSINSYIVDPRQQPGLKSWFLSTWM